MASAMLVAAAGVRERCASILHITYIHKQKHTHRRAHTRTHVYNIHEMIHR
jgi:hypothetical protein